MQSQYLTFIYIQLETWGFGEVVDHMEGKRELMSSFLRKKVVSSHFFDTSWNFKPKPSWLSWF